MRERYDQGPGRCNHRVGVRARGHPNPLPAAHTYLKEGRNTLIAQPDTLELLPHAVKQGAPIRQHIHEAAEGSKVLEGIEALDQHVAALGLKGGMGRGASWGTLVRGGATAKQVV